MAYLVKDCGRTDVAESWLSADDIAANLGITKDTVYSWIAENAMPSHKVGFLWKILAGDVRDGMQNGHAPSEDRK